MLRARAVVLLGLAGACSVYRDSLGDAARPSGEGGTNSGGRASAPGGSGNASAGEAPESPQAGQGGTNGAGSGAGGAPDPEAATGGAGGESLAPPTLDLIDDMEDGDAFVVSSDGRNGHWDVSNDGTTDATQQPPPASFVMVELAPGERPGSELAAYTQGAGFKDWGAFMTVSMRTWPKYEETPVYDASR